MDVTLKKIGSTLALIMLLLFRKSDSAKEGNAIILLQKVDAARHNGKITLSLNDFTDSVSKRILPNLLGASSNIEPMNFLHHLLLQQSVHGISDPTQNNRLC
jgi:hypothetical protein